MTTTLTIIDTPAKAVCVQLGNQITALRLCLNEPQALDAVEDLQAALEALESALNDNDRAQRAFAVIDAESWYDSYGWHLSTRRAGDVCLQVVDYGNAEGDTDEIAAKLAESDTDLRLDEARVIAERACSVRDAMDQIACSLSLAVEAWQADEQSVQEHLRSARYEESQHGDAPATAQVAEILGVEID